MRLSTNGIRVSGVQDKRLAVYNCDSYSEVAIGQNVLDNMRSFGVPPCHGELIFDERCFGSIDNEDREADMIEVLKNLLNSE